MQRRGALGGAMPMGRVSLHVKLSGKPGSPEGVGEWAVMAGYTHVSDRIAIRTLSSIMTVMTCRRRHHQ